MEIWANQNDRSTLLTIKLCTEQTHYPTSMPMSRARPPLVSSQRGNTTYWLKCLSVLNRVGVMLSSSSQTSQITINSVSHRKHSSGNVIPKKKKKINEDLVNSQWRAGIRTVKKAESALTQTYGGYATKNQEIICPFLPLYPTAMLVKLCKMCT